jgi:SAM-dependent methyltransferase
VVLSRVGWRRRKVTVLRHPFDAQYGVDTSGFIGGGALSNGNDNDRFTTGYHAVAQSRLDEVLERWRSMQGTRAIEEYAFVDVGCGKGRAMMLASERSFREVAGVELNAHLAAIAEKNLARWQEIGLPRTSLRLVLGDATEVALPALPLLVFLYNPFGAPVLRLLLQRLEDAAGNVSGLVDVIYVVPGQEAVFAEFPRFQQLWIGTVGISREDAAVDSVSSPQDRCNMYRR